jgi:hypothetical protein
MLIAVIHILLNSLRVSLVRRHQARRLPGYIPADVRVSAMKLPCSEAWQKGHPEYKCGRRNFEYEVATFNYYPY